MVWGQAIAGYAEVDDALADGRLDLSYSLPIYNPSDYPSFDATASALSGLPISPVRGEAIYNAVAGDLGWQTESLLAEYEENGVVPLNPLVSSGNYWAACNAPGSESDDWQGRQIRIGGSAQTPISENLGASPVSMEYGEVFEALQRSTVDCTFIQGMVAGSTGLLEVAPHLSTLGEDRFTGAVTAGHVAGSSFETLPLPYQQIIFDAANEAPFAGFRRDLDGRRQPRMAVRTGEGAPAARSSPFDAGDG